MIKKIRIKLIAAAMLSLFVVLTVIMIIIAVISYQNVITAADTVLALLAENEGEFPETDDYRNDSSSSNSRLNSQELPYESRYFSVLLTGDGEIISSDLGNIAAVDNSMAAIYAQTIMEEQTTNGFVDDYRYLVTDTDTGILIIFLDCGNNIGTWRTLVFTCTIVSVVGLAAVFLLLLFLSDRIVKPFAENHEKQKRFITDAGHELKTPLAIISADMEILEADFGENEWISDVRHQTKRMTDLTNNLITLSRMDEEDIKSKRIEFSLSDLTEEMVQSFQGPARTGSKTLSADIQPLISIRGDEKALRQLVSVLLDNAMKYTDAGGRISVTLKKQRNQIRLAVFNTTESISRDHLKHLFDRFYRTDQSRNSGTGGYGLGLSIAAAAVQSHKGKIFASTEDEKSLLITVLLPIS
ncbi:MAG: HAMP domain-containing histidine kinase [Clostridiales bacterium]|nr:HAMP domain-containing histidine kinase [Clostridiales bacterium]